MRTVHFYNTDTEIETYSLIDLFLYFSAHPNCVLFITHGGLLSTTEAVHFGKPIIGIPVFADQFGNVDKAVRKGFARRVDLSYTMDKDLEVEVNEIVGNSK